MPDRNHVSDADLVVYNDWDLDEARRTRIEKHLAVCPGCRERLASFREVTRLIQEHYPLIDDPVARDQIMERIRAEKEKRAQSASRRRQPD